VASVLVERRVQLDGCVVIELRGELDLGVWCETAPGRVFGQVPLSCRSRPGWVGVGRFLVAGVALLLGVGRGRCSGGVGGPAAVRGVGEAEGGQAGEVDGGGEEVEVGADTQLSAHAGASSAVAAAHQVGDLALDFRAGGAVVGFPRWVGLFVAGGGQAGFVVADGDSAAGLGGGALSGQGAGGAGGAELGLAGMAGVTGDSPDRHGDLVGAGDGAGVQVDVELVLGELPGGGDRGLHLQSRLDTGRVQLLQDLTGPVSRVAVSDRDTRIITCGRTIPQIPQQVDGRLRVAGVARGNRGRGDHLAVRVDSQVTLVPIEAAVVGLVSVPGLRIHRGDHPVWGHFPRNP